MSNTKSTPAPWKLIDNDDTGEVGTLIVGADGTLVADIYPSTAMGLELPSEDEYRANGAQLMAAPDLLAALVKMVEWSADTSKDRPIIEASEAIAKGRG